MGVGVYTSNFNGTGETWLISGPLGTEEDYQTYVKESDDPDDVMDHELWSQTQYDDFNEAMIEVAEDAAEALGFVITDRKGRFLADRASFDNEFVSIAEDDHLEIGWRSWEHDFVIGVAAIGNWSDWAADGDDADLIAETGRAPDDARDIFADMLAAASAYIRLVMNERFDCRYRTSGYTSAAYEQPDDVEAAKQEQLDKFNAAKASLDLDPSAVIPSLAAEKRIALAKAIKDNEHCDIKVLVPFYDNENKSASAWDALSGKIVCSMTPPDDVETLIGGLENIDGLSPIPRTEQTEAWFGEFMSKGRMAGRRLLLSVDEAVKAFDEPLRLEYEDGDQIVELEFEGSSSPAPASPL